MGAKKTTAKVPDAKRIEQLLADDLKAIDAKVQAGMVLTDAEVRRLRDAAAREGATESTVLDGKHARNQVELAEALNCDRKTIARLLKLDGNPGRKADGRYDVTAWKMWCIDTGHLRRQIGGGGDKTDLEVQSLLLKNERLEMENAIRRGELCHVDEVNSVLGEMLRAFSAELRQRRHSLAPKVVGVTIGEASKRIGVTDREALTQLSLGEWAKKKPFWSKVYAALSDLHRSCSLGDGLSAT